MGSCGNKESEDHPEGFRTDRREGKIQGRRNQPEIEPGIKYRGVKMARQMGIESLNKKIEKAEQNVSRT